MSGEPKAGQWPAEDLEWLGACPVCGSKARSLLLDGVQDDVFKCAPGTWMLYRCAQCGNGYLDPRPDRASIGNAYASYYTHSQPDGRDDYTSLGLMRRLRRRASNAYTNRRYGTSLQPADDWTGTLLGCAPGVRHVLDVQHRWLPRPLANGRLLDVGCGNGAFLNHAAAAGWAAYGVDPDPKAIQQVLSLGHRAKQGGIDAYADMVGGFDAITFSHSIEHVHDPVADLRMAWDLLKPGGVLYVDTPNLGSAGLRRFRGAWRGVEAPRHLVIFERSAFVRLLLTCGFDGVVVRPRYAVARYMHAVSRLIEMRRSPYEQPPRSVRWFSWLSAFAARLQGSSEFVTVTCIKGDR